MSAATEQQKKSVTCTWSLIKKMSTFSCHISDTSSGISATHSYQIERPLVSAIINAEDRIDCETVTLLFNHDASHLMLHPMVKMPLIRRFFPKPMRIFM